MGDAFPPDTVGDAVVKVDAAKPKQLSSVKIVPVTLERSRVPLALIAGCTRPTVAMPSGDV